MYLFKFFFFFILSSIIYDNRNKLLNRETKKMSITSPLDPNGISDEYLIEEIRTGGFRKEKAIVLIWNNEKLKKRVYHHVMKTGGNHEDANDVFTDSILTFVRIVEQKEFKVKVSVTAYIYGISRFIWFDRLGKKKKSILIFVEELKTLFDTSSPLIRNHLNRLTRKECQEKIKEEIDKLEKIDRMIVILRIEGYSYNEILLNIKENFQKDDNVDRLRKRYQLCTSRLRTIISQKPWSNDCKEDLKNK